MKIALSVAVFLAALAALLYSPASRAGLVGIDENTNRLIAIDPATGAQTETGLVAGVPGPGRGLTYDSATDAYYAVEPTGASVSRIDAATGLSTGLGPVGTNGIQSLAYDAASGILYAARSNTSGLMVIDTSTGAGTTIALVSAGAIFGLAFDDVTGTLYGTNASQIFAIDTATGASVNTFGIFGFASNALAYDPTSGNFYGFDATTWQFIVADTATGAVSTIGAPGDRIIRGLTYVPESVSEVPEPGGIVFLAAGLVLLAQRRRAA